MTKLQAAQKLANVTLGIGSRSKWDDLREFIMKGGDPYTHPFYFAHVVLNERKVFDFWVNKIKTELKSEFNNPENLPTPEAPLRFLLKGEWLKGDETFTTFGGRHIRTGYQKGGPVEEKGITYFTTRPLPV